MVEYNASAPAAANIDSLDSVFGSLADATRRDILQQVTKCELSISEIAARYDLTFAAISKHIKILEKAKLIVKRRRGKEQMVTLAPHAFKDAEQYLEYYRQTMENHFDALEQFLREDNKR
jgi:DNA-binding transcriptional ArsR family regulator